MTNRDAARAPAGERVRRMTRLPRDVAGLTGELSALRTEVAALRTDVLDLGRRLPVGDTAGPPRDAVPSDLEEQPFDDGIELFAERMAVLEDGLDDVAQRLEGMARDSVNQVAAKLELLTQRVNALASQPSLTPEQLEEALARVANLSRSSSR